MPKDGDEQKKKRSNAIQDGYKTAANVPLETAKTCIQGLTLAKTVAEKGNKNSITDAAVSALMLKAGFESAVLNVKINLGFIKDEKYVSNIVDQIREMEKYSKEKTKEVLAIVDEIL
jgi:formiminotetrahydrofolate cyclodeaminase